MIFFLKKLKPNLLVPSIEFINEVLLPTNRAMQVEGNLKVSKINTTLFVAMVLLFLTGCTAQQIGQLLEKIPDAKVNQYTLEPSGQPSQDYSDNSYPSDDYSNQSIVEPTAQPAETMIQATPKIIYFKAERGSVLLGDSTALKWRAENVTSVQILGIGSVAATGKHVVTPRKPTEYKLIATNSIGQTVSDKVMVGTHSYARIPQTQKPRPANATNYQTPRRHRPTCASQVQGKIAWNYKGNKRWAQNNINRLCKGAVNSSEPARCFKRVMHGGVNWGGGTKWKWSNASDLCEGSKNSTSTIRCFQQLVKTRVPWKTAILKCS